MIWRPQEAHAKYLKAKENAILKKEQPQSKGFAWDSLFSMEPEEMKHALVSVDLRRPKETIDHANGTLENNNGAAAVNEDPVSNGVSEDKNGAAAGKENFKGSAEDAPTNGVPENTKGSLENKINIVGIENGDPHNGDAFSGGKKGNDSSQHSAD